MYRGNLCDGLKFCKVTEGKMLAQGCQGAVHNIFFQFCHGRYLWNCSSVVTGEVDLDQGLLVERYTTGPIVARRVVH